MLLWVGRWQNENLRAHMYAKRVDENQKHIVNELRNHGRSVFVASATGSGFPDLVVGYKNKTHLIEVKKPCKDPTKKLTPAQQKFHNTWKGSKIHIVTSAHEALEITCKHD